MRILLTEATSSFFFDSVICTLFCGQLRAFDLTRVSSKVTRLSRAMPMFAESSAFPAYEAGRLRDLLFPPERQSLHGYAKATITGAYPYVSWIMRIAEAEPWKGKKEMPKVRRISPPYGRGHTALSLHWQGYCREMASSRSLIARSVLAGGVVAGASARLERRSKTLDFVWAREADC